MRRMTRILLDNVKTKPGYPRFIDGLSTEKASHSFGISVDIHGLSMLYLLPNPPTI